jgi:hypothetical protein
MSSYDLLPVPSSNTSGEPRRSLDSIDLDYPSLRLMMHDNSDFTENPNTGGLAHVPLRSSTIAPVRTISASDPTNEKGAKAATFEVLPPIRKRSVLIDWWEEIASVTFASMCLALTLTVLLYMDNKAMRNWKLHIQPNSLVALLATLARAALIFPLSECVGHLKWVYFERPRSLAHMHQFDIASRGPTGAFKFLYKAKATSLLASFTAAVIILLLLFQPFVQQTIVISSRFAPKETGVAVATMTTTWWLNQSTYHEHGIPRCK